MMRPGRVIDVTNGNEPISHNLPPDDADATAMQLSAAFSERLRIHGHVGLHAHPGDRDSSREWILAPTDCRNHLRESALISTAAALAGLITGAIVLHALKAVPALHGYVSHHAPAQYLSVASALVWIVLVPAYYRQFEWNPATRRWRTAFLAWWGGLVFTGWIMFLPGVLDRLKFTDALVGHSLVAVAGFLSAYLIFILVQMPGEDDAWILNRTWSFYAWNLGVLAHVVVMMFAGWIEGTNPAFTIAPGAVRDSVYAICLLTGVVMLTASIEWFIASQSLATRADDAQARLRKVEVA